MEYLTSHLHFSRYRHEPLVDFVNQENTSEWKSGTMKRIDNAIESTPTNTTKAPHDGKVGCYTVDYPGGFSVF